MGATVYAHAFSPDEKRALTGADDTIVRPWDVETGLCLCVFEGHESSAETIAWSADGSRTFPGDYNGGIRVWVLSGYVTEARQSGTCRYAFPNEPGCVLQGSD